MKYLLGLWESVPFISVQYSLPPDGSNFEINKNCVNVRPLTFYI